MRKATIKIHGEVAGELTELTKSNYIFEYISKYNGPPISLTMPVAKVRFEFDRFPPFFDGLLPEGIQLVGLLKKCKIDKYDYFQQLITTGSDLVGAVTVHQNSPANE